MPGDRLIKCGVPVDEKDVDGRIAFQVDGRLHTARLRIDRLERRLVTRLPERVIDLLEIAGYVYAVDAAIPRGGPTDRSMGADWRRNLHFEIPVRDLEFWDTNKVRLGLADTLKLLSDDLYGFSFSAHKSPPEQAKYFQFQSDESFTADVVMPFSGGLDSFAGALEELLHRHHRVALVSHSSANTMLPVQRSLVEELRKLAGADRLLHIPVTLQLSGGSNRESTHRTRSFFSRH